MGLNEEVSHCTKIEICKISGTDQNGKMQKMSGMEGVILMAQVVVSPLQQKPTVNEIGHIGESVKYVERDSESQQYVEKEHTTSSHTHPHLFVPFYVKCKNQDVYLMSITKYLRSLSLKVNSQN